MKGTFRIAVVVFGAQIPLSFLLWTAGGARAQTGKDANGAVAVPTASWPQFRGPNGSGVSYGPRIGTVGMCICYDIMFPETTRALTLAGADAFHEADRWLSQGKSEEAKQRFKELAERFGTTWIGRASRKRLEKIGEQQGSPEPEQQR